MGLNLYFEIQFCIPTIRFVLVVASLSLGILEVLYGFALDFNRRNCEQTSIIEILLISLVQYPVLHEKLQFFFSIDAISGLHIVFKCIPWLLNMVGTPPNGTCESIINFVTIIIPEYGIWIALQAHAKLLLQHHISFTFKAILRILYHQVSEVNECVSHNCSLRGRSAFLYQFYFDKALRIFVADFKWAPLRQFDISSIQSVGCYSS